MITKRSALLKTLLLLLANFGFQYRADAACQSCLLAPVHHHYHGQSATSRAAWGHISSTIQQSTRLADWKRLAVHGVSQRPALAITAAIGVSCLVVPKAVSQRRSWLPSTNEEGKSDEMSKGDERSGDSEAPEATSRKEAENPVSSGMISALGFYKGFISPLLPPACRFVPTCSQYGVQAIKEFGPGKGSILITWRLMRCSPFGGKGFDPPKWPPVGYTYGSW